MNSSAWMFLGITGLIFALIVSYGYYFTWYAHKNPEYFELSGTSKDIFRLRKMVQKNRFESSSNKPKFILMVLSSMPLLLTSISDGEIDYFTLFILALFSPVWILIILSNKNIVIKSASILYLSGFLRREFKLQNVKEINIKYIGPVYRAGLAYSITVIENSDYFTQDFTTQTGRDLFFCIIDVVFKSNPSISLKFLTKDGTPDPDYESLIQAKKPLGIFVDEP